MGRRQGRRPRARPREPQRELTQAPNPPAHRPVQIEGRGNGIKTNVVNNVDIAKALERPPECECPTRLQH